MSFNAGDFHRGGRNKDLELETRKKQTHSWLLGPMERGGGEESNCHLRGLQKKQGPQERARFQEGEGNFQRRG